MSLATEALRQCTRTNGRRRAAGDSTCADSPGGGEGRNQQERLESAELVRARDAHRSFRQERLDGTLPRTIRVNRAFEKCED
jgi:hypothetical protein